LGKLSFAVYLVHYSVIIYFRLNYGRNIDVICACFVSIGLAQIIYVIAEKTFSVLGKTTEITDLINYYKNLLR
jgi:peptidoglycan/LPS O-acetylase OafA/YrhL